MTTRKRHDYEPDHTAFQTLAVYIIRHAMQEQEEQPGVPLKLWDCKGFDIICSYVGLEPTAVVRQIHKNISLNLITKLVDESDLHFDRTDVVLHRSEDQTTTDNQQLVCQKSNVNENQ